MTSRSSTRELTEPRIWASVIRGLQLPLHEHAIDFEALLELCGIGEADLKKAQGKIPLRRYLRFMEEAAVTANDPLLGIKLARSCGPETLGAVGFLFLSSRTLAEAISDFCKYLNLLQDTTDFRSRQGRNKLTFYYQMYGVPDIDCRQDVEFSLALSCRLIRIFAGPEVTVSNISFRHAPSSPVSEYERLLQTEVRFNQDANSIAVPSSMGRMRGTALDASLSGVLKDLLDAELMRRGRINTLADQIRHMLIGNRISAPVTAARTAMHLGISTATLYRKLKVEGTTFGNILDEVNFELAKRYLSDSNLTVTQIGHVAGFAESASFTRAFSRWSGGITPSQFRRNSG